MSQQYYLVVLQINTILISMHVELDLPLFQVIILSNTSLQIEIQGNGRHY